MKIKHKTKKKLSDRCTSNWGTNFCSYRSLHCYFLVGVAQESQWIWQTSGTSGKHTKRFFIFFRMHVRTATPWQYLSAKGCHLYMFRIGSFLPVFYLSNAEYKTSYPIQGAADFPWIFRHLSDKPISLYPNKETEKFGISVTILIFSSKSLNKIIYFESSPFSLSHLWFFFF